MRNSESDHPSKTRHLPAHLSIDLRGSERSKGVSASPRQGRPVRIMLHGSDKVSLVRKVNKV
jgi:hypothetical protein